MPEPGYDMYDFIRKNQKYPKEAYEAGVEGRVNVQFIVTEQGYFDSVKMVKQLYPSLDAEATRIVKAMPQPWKPGKMGGKVVRVHYTIPIIFRAE
jgi:protein TonB